MLFLVVSCLNDISQQVNDNDLRSCSHPENLNANDSSMPSRGKYASFRRPDRPPSSDFVARAEFRVHFVTVQTLFSQLQDNISSSSIVHGGTGAIYIFMAPLTLFNEALKRKSITPLTL